MAIKNDRIFGLSASLSLADIPDRNTALANLGINKQDLEVIRDISTVGFDREDLQTISNLNVPIWKTFDRYINDVTTYSGLLTDSGGADFQLRGNLKVAGGIGSTAFRYPILDTEPDPSTPGSTPVLKWGDISTSRVSSWSTIGNTISYGADVEIGGTLKVGKIKTRTIANTKQFDSEVPTHRIKINLNGVDKYIYAMKGIPIKFTGYFRNFLAEIETNGGVSASWRVISTSGIEDFPNLGNRLDYKNPLADQRTIEIYKNPLQITSISISNSNIRSLPKIRFDLLNNFIFQNNGLVDFPDVNFLAPSLKKLDLRNNKFFNSSDANERRLNQNIADKLPGTLREIYLQNCFVGGIEQGIFTKFEDLIRLDINTPGNTSNIFYPDTTNPNGELPFFFGDINNTDTHKLRYLNASYNDFRSIGSPNNANNELSIEQLSSLETLLVYSNRNLEKNNFQIASNNIVTVNIGATKLSCPNMQNKGALVTFSSTFNQTGFGSLFNNWDGTLPEPVGLTDASYKFSGCTSLTNFSLYANASVSGYIPKFIGNRSLRTLDLRFCNNLIAGRPEKGTDIKCLYDDTFVDAVSLENFYLSVNNVNFAGPVDVNTFLPVENTLRSLYLYAAGRFTGAFPNLETCTALVDVRSNNQGWSSTLPNFSSANNIVNIFLQSNNFTGNLQYNNKPSLTYINVSNNNLDSISSGFNVVNLKTLLASSNNFTDSLPNLGVSCPIVETVDLSNNQYTSYARGSGLESLSKLKSLDLSSNILSRTAVDNILFDLVDNYNAFNRRSVVVNLSGSNDSPSPYPVTPGIISAFDPINQPTIENGVITGFGNNINVPLNYFPVNQSYTFNLSGGSGVSSQIKFDVSSSYDQNVVTQISTSFNAPRNVQPQGIVDGLGTYTAPSSPYNSGNFTDQNPPAGGVPASVTITTDVNGEVTNVGILSGGQGYTAGDTITVQNTIVINVASVSDTPSPYTSGTFADENPPAGGSAAQVSVSVDGTGKVTGLTLVSGGAGYTAGDTITIQSDVTVSVSSIIERYYNSASYNVTINSGGAFYSVDDQLTTPSNIRFEDIDGNIITRELNLTVQSITSVVDTSVFVGIAAAEFLRSKGWSVQISN